MNKKRVPPPETPCAPQSATPPPKKKAQRTSSRTRSDPDSERQLRFGESIPVQSMYGRFTYTFGGFSMLT